jgi:5'-nucleotidase
MYFNKVLIVNDDGIEALGIMKLVEQVKLFSKEILIVAPSTVKSAASHSMTISEGLKLTKYPFSKFGCLAYSLSGTPVDCVKFALIHFSYTPDVVFSGCNSGLNLGNDILYSGTVAAATEANFFGIRGIAVSSNINEFDELSHLDDVVKYIFDTGLLQASGVLNINFPLKSKGIKVTHQGKNPFDTYFSLENNLFYPKGAPLGKAIEFDKTSDVRAVSDGYISISPLTVNHTDIGIYNCYKDDSKIDF